MLNDVITHPDQLLETLETLRADVMRTGERMVAGWQPRITRSAFLPGAQNLAYYLALRKRDLRGVQISLMPWGLSSLGHIESRVIEGLDAVIHTLRSALWHDVRSIPAREAYFNGNEILEREAEVVLGKMPPDRRVRIMVTFPGEAADNYDFVRDLLARGMNCARINCAHDNADAWQAMIAHVRRAEDELGRTCRVMMDLAGPKIRTVAMSFGKKQAFQIGDSLLLTRSEPQNSREYPHQISCNVPEVLTQVKVGETVWFDDGKVGTRVEQIVNGDLLLRVTHVRAEGRTIKPEKGINFPDTALHLNPLTEKDLRDLDFVAANADLISYSFVQSADDVRLLQSELDLRLGQAWTNKPLIAKIETRTALQNLPDIIVQAAGHQPLGVMIARGDLAVEIGFDRLAEMQEEILWLCEAAHVPVIWATQVFETLVKDGLPSRAEVTDAAMSERAECVMLNKGAFILEGVMALDNVLQRMSAHQFKRIPGLRALRSWTTEQA